MLRAFLFSRVWGETQPILSIFIKTKQIWSSVFKYNSHCAHIDQIYFKFCLGKILFLWEGQKILATWTRFDLKMQSKTDESNVGSNTLKPVSSSVVKCWYLLLIIERVDVETSVKWLLVLLWVCFILSFNFTFHPFIIFQIPISCVCLCSC